MGEMPEMSDTLNKLQARIGNKQSELNKLYADREKLEKQIARLEGEVNGLRDAQAVVAETK